MPDHIKDSDFEEKVLKSSGTVLVDFFATWCGPCQLLAPVLEEIEPKTHTKIFKMDVEASPKTPVQFNVKSVPSLVLFKNGKEVDRKTGFITAVDLLTWIEQKSSSCCSI